MFQKKVFILFSISFMVLFLIVYTQNNGANDSVDMIIIYDNNGNEISKINDLSQIKYYSELIGNSVENIDEENAQIIYKTIPEDAIISYKYSMIHTKSNGDENITEFYVYENYPYITLQGLPTMPSLTWELSEKDRYRLQTINK